MKRFEIGHTYRVDGGGTVTVTGRTDKYLDVVGRHNGRKQIYDSNMFNLGELIMLPSGIPHTRLFVFAEHEKI